MNLYATILAGGSGTRFWPVSRAHVPKQFLVLQGTQSLLQATAQRIAPLIPPQRIYVVTAAHLQAQTVGQLPEVPAANILSEPVGRNTAMGLLRWAGHPNIAAACRRLAAQPAQALALIGIEFEN